MINFFIFILTIITAGYIRGNKVTRLPCYTAVVMWLVGLTIYFFEVHDFGEVITIVLSYPLITIITFEISFIMCILLEWLGYAIGRWVYRRHLKVKNEEIL